MKRLLKALLLTIVPMLVGCGIGMTIMELTGLPFYAFLCALVAGCFMFNYLMNE